MQLYNHPPPPPPPRVLVKYFYLVSFIALERKNRGVKKLGESENDIGQQRMILYRVRYVKVYHIAYQNLALEICNRLVS